MKRIVSVACSERFNFVGQTGVIIFETLLLKGKQT